MSRLVLDMVSPERPAYADSVGFIRVKEKRDLLNRARLNELLAMEPKAILERLAQGRAAVPPEATEELDAVLGSVLAGEYDEVERFDHQRMVMPVLRRRQDLHNLKALLRGKHFGAEPSLSSVTGWLSVTAIREHVSEGRRASWPGPLGAAVDDVLVRANGHRAGDWIDLELDLAWLEYAEQATAGMPLIRHYYQCLGDFSALRYAWRKAAAGSLGLEVSEVAPRVYRLDPAILRLQDRERLADAVQASPYGRHLKEGLAEWRATGSWMPLERDLAGFLMGELAPARFLSMGPEPLFAYLLARENDLVNVRTLCVLKAQGWSQADLKKHLWRLYV